MARRIGSLPDRGWTCAHACPAGRGTTQPDIDAAQSKDVAPRHSGRARRAQDAVSAPRVNTDPLPTDTCKLLLAGDVMTGRGIDQALPHPLPPQLHEPWVQDAREYLRLAERASGSWTRPVSLDYPWGDALAAIERLAPDLFIVNLETAITTSESLDCGKGIHYRMNPRHVGCLRAAGIDACTLANNHVLDWRSDGLRETLATLHAAGIATAGAGLDVRQACAPAVLVVPGGLRLLLFAWATTNSGVPPDWAATSERPGVSLLNHLDEAAAQTVLRCVQRHRAAEDRVVVSLHWGDNWVHDIPEAQRRFARRLIDLGAADVVHGHSSHHPLPPEVHEGKLILHGCGDLINDYEGIAPHGALRSDVGCLYAATIARADGHLCALQIVPFPTRRFRLSTPDLAARQWLRDLMASGGAGLDAVEGPLQGSWRLAMR